MAGDCAAGPPPGVSAFANRRGGPGTFSGTSYQLDLAVARCLEWLSDSLVNPARVVSLACEARLMAGDSGQIGFDFGRLEGHTREMYEAKANPSNQDVADFLDSVSAVVGEGSAAASTECLFVGGSNTPALGALQSLRDRMKECAGDETVLRDLVARGGRSGEAAALAHLGDSPLRVLAALGAPELQPEAGIRTQSHWLAQRMAPPGRQDALLAELRVQIEAGSRGRHALDLTSMASDLVDRGLLARPPLLDVSSSAKPLVDALCVLQECHAPLPAEVLAAAADTDVDGLLDVLGDHLDSGAVRFEAGCFIVGAQSMKLAVDVDSCARALECLTDLADGNVRYADQSRTALALARICLDDRPDAVTRVFVAFDKPVKAWGDLHVTFDLARVATAAVIREIDSCRNEARRQTLMHQKSHTKTCGQSWVLQRVGEVDRSITELEEALAINDAFPEPANHAFGLKCMGRLKRMKSEELDVADPTRSTLLDESMDLLRRAFEEFDLLVGSRPEFMSDHGECLSLLARTLFIAGHGVQAELEAGRAEALLGVDLGSKAYADVLILRGEMALQASVGVLEPSAVVEPVISSMRELTDFHLRVLGSGYAPGSSEIVARAMVIAGRAHEAVGARTAARADFDAAAQMYADMRYPGARDTALWSALQVSDEPVPDGLLDALAALGATDADRLLACRDWLGSSAASPGGAAGPSDSPLYEAIVRKAMRRRKSMAQKWGEEMSA